MSWLRSVAGADHQTLRQLRVPAPQSLSISPTSAPVRLAAAVALFSLAAGLPAAAVPGGARAVDYDEAVGRTRTAAGAVVARSGTESCLRGKLTNALLVMVASCEAAGERNALCELSREAVVRPSWSAEFMEATARQLLDLLNGKARL
jgi:hypothetical protein